MKHALILLAFAGTVAAATITNYYQVVTLDGSTILCDSRVSCADYSEGISGFVEDVSGLFYFELTPSSFGAMAYTQQSMVSDRYDVRVHHTVTFRDSADLGLYKYVGGVPGTSFSPEFSGDSCIYLNTTSPANSFNFGASFSPFLPVPCMSGEVRGTGVFGEPFRVSGEVNVSFTIQLGPGEMCGNCQIQSIHSFSQFSGTGFQNGMRLDGLEIVPASVPEPSTYPLFGCGLIALYSISKSRLCRRTGYQSGRC